MNNDALIKEACSIDKTREHWPLVKRLADALAAASAREAKANAERDAALRRAESAEGDCALHQRNACEHCGSKRISQSAPGCAMCGAPVCCQTCCETATAEAERDTLRTHIAALRKEAAEAIWQAYKEGCNDGVFNENNNTSKPGRFFCDSTARRAAQRIGGAE